MFTETLPDSTQKPLRVVLVVEDNQVSAMTLSWAMELYGCEVRACFDGKSTVAVAHDFRPEVGLLESACRSWTATRSAGNYAETRFWNGRGSWRKRGGDTEIRRRAVDAGFNDHWTKPVDLTTL